MDWRRPNQSWDLQRSVTVCKDLGSRRPSPHLARIFLTLLALAPSRACCAMYLFTLMRPSIQGVTGAASRRLPSPPSLGIACQMFYIAVCRCLACPGIILIQSRETDPCSWWSHVPFPGAQHTRPPDWQEASVCQGRPRWPNVLECIAALPRPPSMDHRLCMWRQPLDWPEISRCCTLPL